MRAEAAGNGAQAEFANREASKATSALSNSAPVVELAPELFLLLFGPG
jgi:hypothetical protein